jgi:dTDP-4-dehydrorhamnose reductase
MIDCLVTGAGGALGSVVMRRLAREHKHAYGLVSRDGPTPAHGQTLRVELTDPRSYRDHILTLAPRAIIHLAAISKPSAVLADPELAHAVNVDATAALVELASMLGARFFYASTDMVFDGESGPYSERDATEPGTLYGRMKLEGECHVLAHPGALVARLPLLYGNPAVARASTFFEDMVQALLVGRPIQLFEDELRSPLWLEDAAEACIRLSETAISGVLHVAGPEGLSRVEMGQRLAAALSCSPTPLVTTRRDAMPGPEPRPRDLRLDCSRYLAEFGVLPGRPMHIALPLALARDPHQLPS